MRIARQFFMLFSGVIFFVTGAFAASSNAAQADQAQTIEMTAKKYEFNPSPIHVKTGTTVRLKITSTDRAHGIKIEPYPDGAPTKGEPGITFTSKQDCFKFDKNSPVTVEFVAHTPGTYTFKCCVHCGFGHGHMKGQLIVDP
ncbi:MAG TPA: cupredoxin domain-containing protein [Candidatus Angelobacter sp.]|nr:cupredoxin domain-containing protein [Candidatus Angelobacter sp.]